MKKKEERYRFDLKEEEFYIGEDRKNILLCMVCFKEYSVFTPNSTLKNHMYRHKMKGE